MALTLQIDALDPGRLGRYWSELLGLPLEPDPRGPLIVGDDRRPGLRFTATITEPTVPNPIHLHLTSAEPADQDKTVERAVVLGGRPVRVGPLPEDNHVVADPEGNEFCVIEAGNAYLAGTGFLGEFACDGTRAVGLFWRDVMGWPLVWDRGEETAIQSPAGGTKVAWGGPPLRPRDGRPRQRFELRVTDPTEVDRLVALGATRLRDDDGAVVLADPDGNEFILRGAS